MESKTAASPVPQVPSASSHHRTASNPTSLSSSRRSSRHSASNLSLDLSSLPPLVKPSPPSNTLLITNLMDPSIFHPASLATIRENISRTASLYAFSPLKSFRRIVATFYNIDDAIAIRQQLDGEDILGARVRVFFGTQTPVDTDARNRHLAAPQADKLFFISPPPSPPHGWEMRNEEPPNKEVHAEDLASALSKLHAKTAPLGDSDCAEEDMVMASPVTPSRVDSYGLDGGLKAAREGQGQHTRTRSGSTTIVYHPDHHGDSPALPAVMVEDTTCVAEDPDAMEEDTERKIMAHTARPPVELMSEV